MSDLESQLREALRYLAHDAREGHSSTLALIELQRVRADSMSAAELARRLERNARRSLRRIDDFVAFARARSQEMTMEELDLLDVLYDCVAELWQASNERGVRLKVGQAPQEEVLLMADRGMLRMAIERLVQLAIEQCKSGSDLICAVHQEAETWRIDIDEVRRREVDEAPATAQPPAESEHAWPLVELLVNRLGGSVAHEDAPERGVRFCVAMPRK